MTYQSNPMSVGGIAVSGGAALGAPLLPDAEFTNSGLLAILPEGSDTDIGVTFVNGFDVTLFAGSLPPGLSVNSEGRITGRTEAAASSQTYSFTLRIVNSQGRAATGVFSLSVRPLWSVAAGSLGSFNEQASLTTSVAATADPGVPVSHSIVSGALPSGLSLNSTTGEITGTPDSVHSDTTFSFTVRAALQNGFSTDRSYSITILNVVAPVSWTTPAGSVGSFNEATPFSFTFVATAEAAAPSISRIVGSFPPGITLATTGVMSGTTPTVASNTTYAFTLRAADGVSVADRAFSFTVQDNDAEPVWQTPAGSLGSYTSGALVSIGLVATDENPITSFGVVSGSLPPNLSLASSGTISGTLVSVENPVATSFTVRATDNIGQTSDRSFSITALSNAPLWQSPSAGSLGSFDEGAVVTQTFVALYTDSYSVIGTLPQGLLLNSASGVLAGTLAAVSDHTTHSFTIRATGAGGTADQTYAMRVLDVSPWMTWNDATFRNALLVRPTIVSLPVIDASAWFSWGDGTYSNALLAAPGTVAFDVPWEGTAPPANSYWTWADATYNNTLLVIPSTVSGDADWTVEPSNVWFTYSGN